MTIYVQLLIPPIRHCEFLGPLAQASRSVSRETATVSPAAISPAVLSTPAQQFSNLPENAPVNMLHVEFVHNLSSEAMTAFNRPGTASGIPYQDILRYGIGAPYLVNEILSLSALHLSIVRPGQRDFYRHHSAQLQNYALKSFNDLSSHINEENYVSIFLFASILGLHIFCETIVFRDDDEFESFLDRFIQYAEIHRGVHLVAGQGRWELLQQTGLKPLLELGERIPLSGKALGPVCQTLIGRIKGRSFDYPDTKAYEQAVQALQSVMTLMENEPPGGNCVDALVAWPVLVPREYIDMVSERKGEALVILAYFGALVDTHK
ncbi:uncharacterized protein N7446_001046 [Penicillium canescens]|uniref:Uncharacterized protein n=1 Tax=Penicillium canescens TaxID=5083 RepID=A0AAD6N4H1_PENCN|nr:uncharacterized protein N7446_001046 [Penicillium canescens]KAJ6029891.1 hypothetical protein N7460_010157 [Penicillium canescens]KAJ6060269.1 hypothetical protein N7444_002123 [Penicillium canescens]KAJ6078110.1 hypothetical protein N7446_001046 [Penicillium canescens]